MIIDFYKIDGQMYACVDGIEKELTYQQAKSFCVEHGIDFSNVLDEIANDGEYNFHKE